MIEAHNRFSVASALRIADRLAEFRPAWLEEPVQEIVDRPVLPVDGYVAVPRGPGLGIDLDWDRLAEHPYRRAHLLHLFSVGWERRDAASPVATTPTHSGEG